MCRWNCNWNRNCCMCRGCRWENQCGSWCGNRCCNYWENQCGRQQENRCERCASAGDAKTMRRHGTVRRRGVRERMGQSVGCKRSMPDVLQSRIYCRLCCRNRPDCPGKSELRYELPLFLIERFRPHFRSYAERSSTTKSP